MYFVLPSSFAHYIDHFYLFQSQHPKNHFNSVMHKMSGMMADIGYTPGSVIYVPMLGSFGENTLRSQYVDLFLLPVGTDPS